jgi:hypothetical protein
MEMVIEKQRYTAGGVAVLTRGLHCAVNFTWEPHSTSTTHHLHLQPQPLLNLLPLTSKVKPTHKAQPDSPPTMATSRPQTLLVSLPELAKIIDHSLLHPTMTDSDVSAGLQI